MTGTAIADLHYSFEPFPQGTSMHVHIPTSVRLLAALLAIASLTQPAAADETQTIVDAAATTAKQHSYHVEVTAANGTVTEADIIVPHRIHATSPSAELIAIDSDLYLKQASGWRKLTGMGPQISAIDVVDAIQKERGNLSTRDVGVKLIDGASLHAYRVTNTKTNRIDTVYLDNEGRMVRIDAPSVIVRLSKFGQAVAIVAPK